MHLYKFFIKIPFMKRIVFVLCSIMCFCFFTSCSNSLLPQPTVANQTINQSETTKISDSNKVENLVASQGLKQKIILSWDSFSNAVRYNIYKANSPYENFVQIGETIDATTSFTLKVPAGTDSYFKVTAVDINEKESDFSIIQRGTSLAQPIISEIVRIEDSEDTATNVYWYMNNVDAYKENVRYTVICTDSKGIEIERIAVSGKETSKTMVSFYNLSPNTNYFYTIESYIVTEQNNIETSETLDAATARRLRPNAPINFIANQGISKNEIQLTFTLPDFIDIAISSGVYSQEALYFKIYRREKSIDEEQEFIPICSYFGKSPTDENSGKKNFGSEEYIPGTVVTYIDTVDLKQNIQYEYKVQAFADITKREITSDLSVATNIGWLLPKVNFRTKNYQTEKNQDETAFINASIDFSLEMNCFGLEEIYSFVLEETKEPLIPTSETTPESSTNIFNTIEELNKYVRNYSLSADLDESGYYKYNIYVIPKDKDISCAIDKISAIGEILVTSSIELPKIDFFTVSRGYKYKIVLEWKYNPSYKYSIKYTENNNNEEFEIPEAEIEAALEGKLLDEIITFNHYAEPGTNRTYVISAISSLKKGTDNYPITGSTLDIPKPFITTYSYDSINIGWNPTQGANNYILQAEYLNKNIASTNTIPQSDIIPATNKIQEYSFSQISGNDNVNISGLPINVTLKAYSDVTKTILTLIDEDTYNETIEAVKNTDSQQLTDYLTTTIETNTIGPALIKPIVSQSTYKNHISISWNKINGATGYVIIRNRYNIASKSENIFESTDKYLVTNFNSQPQVSLLDGIEDISSCVEISYANNKFTLNDKQQKQEDFTSKYQTSQSQISWGCPYDYIILPIISTNDEIEYDYETNSKTVSIQSHSFNNVAITRGSSLGYGWNVTASKGWQQNGFSGENSIAENTSIYVSWDNPAIASTITPTFSVYRREENSTSWKTLTSSIKTNYYYDSQIEPGKVYEYAIGLLNETDPTQNENFISYCEKKMDVLFEQEKALAGFVLPTPEITSASRKALPNNAEEIEWPAVKVGGENNRMIDGYVIEVLNHNISANWNKIAELQINSTNKKSIYTQLVDNSTGYLKVLRDYKHYFRIRSFREQDGKRTYSPAPSYTWSDGGENNYVKWGARQITIDEFAKATLIGMSTGMYKARGTEGCNDDGKDITGLSSDSTYNLATDFTVHLEYNNYKALHQPKTNQGEVATVSLTGYLKARGGLAGAYQTHYWTHTTMSIEYLGTSSYGTLKINGEDKKGSDKVSRNSGTIDVTYNGESKTYDMGSNPGFTLPFAVKGGYLNDTEEWK